MRVEVVDMTEDRKKLGERGEDAAAAFLDRIGMTVVERNWRTTAGEVDIIALDGDEVVFCEVKTRRTIAKGFRSRKSCCRPTCARRAMSPAGLANGTWARLPSSVR